MGADDLSQQVPGDTKAALDYHVLQGLHTAALLQGPSQFIPSHLTDPAYSNVTGGLTVEVSSGLISLMLSLICQIFNFEGL